MDFAFTEDQNSIRDLVKQVLTDIVTDDSPKRSPRRALGSTSAHGSSSPNRRCSALRFPKNTAARVWA